MRDIRAAAVVLSVLIAAYCGTVSGETVSETAEVAASGTRPDTAAVASPRYKEAEPVLNVAVREHPRPPVVLDTPQKEIRYLVDALLLTLAVVTIFSFLGLLKSGRPELKEEAVNRGKERRTRRGAVKSSPSTPEPRAERESPPQSPRERAERLKTRRGQFAAEIERLMKRV